MFAILLAGPLGHHYEMAFEFSMLAYEHAKQNNNQSEFSIACEVHCGHVVHWKKHMKECVTFGTEGFQTALMCGELLWAGHNLQFKSCAIFSLGKPLDYVVAELQEYLEFAIATQVTFPHSNILSLLLVAANLHGLTDNKEDFSYNGTTEAAFLQNNHTLSSVAQFYTYKCFAQYLYGDYQLALKTANQAEPLLVWNKASIAIAEHNFYQSLCLIAVSDHHAINPENLNKAIHNQSIMKYWVDACPENFSHLFNLIKAELARVNKEAVPQVIALYQLAINQAKQFEFIQYQALGNELLGRYLLSTGNDLTGATGALESACYLYNHWGAKAKVDQMRSIYKHLIGNSAKTKQNNQYFQVSEQKQAKNQNPAIENNFDIYSIFKAARSVSSAINLDELVITLINIIIEVAGAEYGYLLLKKDGQWMIESVADASRTADAKFNPIAFNPEQSTQMLATSVINYVIRSGETILLNEATRDFVFLTDPYIISHQAKSILCLPIHHQNNLIAIVYLENDLIESAFTPVLVETVKIIAAQAAISLANAFLYHDLKVEIAERWVAEEQTKDLLAQQHYISRHDSLTGLYNRLYFDEHLLQSIKAEKDSIWYAILLIDIDNFKTINDSLGHKAGDCLLKQIAEDLTDYFGNNPLSKNSVISRYSGDEFFIIVDFPANAFDQLRAWLQNALKYFNRKRLVFETTISNSVSMGATIFPLNSTNPQTLTQQADLAMYEAKINGKAQLAFFTDQLDTAFKHRMEIENGLLNEAGHFGLEILYQPKIHIASNKIIGVEALARWRLLSGKLLQPEQFLSYIRPGKMNEISPRLY